MASFLVAPLIATTFGRLFESISSWHVPNLTRDEAISSTEDFVFPGLPCLSYALFAKMIVPTCPPITDQDLLLRLRTHPTAQQPQPMNDTWGDTDRLQEMGAQVIHMALTAYFFSQKPNLEAAELVVSKSC